MRLRIPAKSALWELASFILFVWLFSAVFWFRAHVSLADLTKLNAVVEFASVEISPGRSNPFVVVLHIKGSSERPGINCGPLAESAKALADQIHPGDSVSIYYDAAGVTAGNNVNLHTYQIENSTRVIFSLSQAHGPNRAGAQMAGAIALFFTIILLFCVWWKRKLANS